MDKTKTIEVSATKARSIDEGLRTYMRSVYNYMTMGLLMTALVGFLIANTPMQGLFFSEQVMDGRTVYGLNLLGIIGIFSPLILVFIINPVIARGQLKAAFGIFMLFSALFGISLANILLAYTGVSLLTYTGVSVARIFVISSAMFAAMSLFGYVTKKDLTSWGSFLFMGLIGIIIAMIVNWFLKSPVLYYAYSFIGVFIFIGLTAYDTQKIRRMYSSHDSGVIMHSKAIMGALALYLDFINLFIMLLSLFGNRR